MKKLNYLMMPLLVVPFLTACNGGDPLVTKEEFEKAMRNDGVEYLQASLMNYTDSVTDMEASGKISPTKFYYIMTNVDEKKKTITECFTIKNDENSYAVSTREGGTGAWGEEETKTKEQVEEDSSWMTPYTFSPKIIIFGGENPDFSKFEYDEKNKYYTCNLEEPTKNDSVDYIIVKFNNKKLDWIKAAQDKEHIDTNYTQVTYTFDQITPTKPE